MADLLAYVDPVAAGDWRRALTSPQLERLGTGSVLFVLTTREAPARACVIAIVEGASFSDGALVGGLPRTLDKDVTAVLAQLGCPDGALATWAATPRILTPADFDRLWYALDLEDDHAPPRIADDETLRTMYVNVCADPFSDDVRSIYADALVERGDPRGELIALQLARAGTTRVATSREKSLLARYADACIGPIAPYLLPPKILRRGFLAECVVDDTRPLPNELLISRAWATVESIATDNLALVRFPGHRAIQRIALRQATVRPLTESALPRPVRVLVGAPLDARTNGPIDARTESLRYDGLTPPQLDATKPGALTSLRVLSVRYDNRPHLLAMLRSPFAAGLEHVDVLAPPTVDLTDLRHAIASTPIRTLTVRDPAHPSRVIGIDRTPDGIIGILETDAPLDTAETRPLVQRLGQLLRPDTVRIEIRDVGFPTHAASRQREPVRLLAHLGFPVDLLAHAVPSLIP